MHTDTVPGQITNDIEFTFNNTQNLYGHGTYKFKVWLIGSHDDNIRNDTLIMNRYSSDVPQVDFSYTADCAGSSIPFDGTASVANGAITGYEWLFDDGDTALVQNLVHIFDTSGLYQVTLRAYTNIGCYGDTTKGVDLLATPRAVFSAQDACFGEALLFENYSTIQNGILNYNWDFGDGSISNQVSPEHHYADSGMYEVALTATAASGCSDIQIDTVEINSQILANLSVNLDTAWCKPTGGVKPYSIKWDNGNTGG